MKQALTPAQDVFLVSTNRFVAWVITNALLGLAMSQSTMLATLHAWLITGTVIVLAASARHITRTVAAAAYVASCDILWRTTDARFYYEGAKYLSTGVLVFCFVRLIRSPRRSVPAIVYLLLLLPSIALTVSEAGLITTRDLVSANLSGPLCLAAAAFVCLSLRASWSDVHTILLALLGPLIALSAVVTVRTVDIGRIDFTTESNLATSGGFGPNQVSAALGLCALVALMLILLNRCASGFYKLIGAFVCLWSLAQSALTFGRGGVVNFAAGALAVLGLRLFEDGDRVRVIARVVALAVAGVVVFAWLNAFTDGALERRFEERSVAGRESIASSDVNIFLAHPLAGVGPGRAGAYREDGFVDRSTHTEFTRLLAEHGVLGAAALACLALMAFRAIVKTPSNLGRAFTVGMLAWSIVNMTHAGMRTAAPSIAFGLAMLRVEDTAALSRELPRRARPLIFTASE